jgi:vacuolar-type H+-ATPase subunit I/STV1
MTQEHIRQLQLVAMQDYKKKLITKQQLVNIVHLLDRKSFIHSA